jgi:hypothetical protein
LIVRVHRQEDANAGDGCHLRDVLDEATRATQLTGERVREKEERGFRVGAKTDQD